MRTLLQLAFLVLTVGGVYFVGSAAERWCPFGGIEALYSYINAGNMTCSLGVSNFYIMGAVLLSAIIFRRVFCGYACPIGALSEWLQHGAARLGLKPRKVPARLDAVLSLLKYPVLAVTLYFTYQTGELIFRAYDPCYALISKHGKDITYWAYVVSGGIVLFSLFLKVPFCRWLCPLAAVLNPFSRFGLARIERSEEACIDCTLCAKACPMVIPVDQVKKVDHARCNFCLDCVDQCPKKEEGALYWNLAGARSLMARSRAALVVVFLGLLAGAVSAAYLFPMPAFTWDRGLEPPAQTESVLLDIEGLTCRGSASELAAFLDRDDLSEIVGYLKLEAWPGEGRAKVIFDPEKCGESAIKAAITEALFDLGQQTWTSSPFKIEGYDPFAPL